MVMLILHQKTHYSTGNAAQSHMTFCHY